MHRDADPITIHILGFGYPFLKLNLCVFLCILGSFNMKHSFGVLNLKLPPRLNNPIIYDIATDPLKRGCLYCN